MISETSAPTLRQRTFKAPDWAIDTVDVHGSEVVFTGWYVSRSTRDVLVNRKKARLEVHARDDLERVFGWLAPEISNVAFHAVADIDPDAVCIEFSLDPHAGVQDYFFPLKSPGGFAMPPVERQQRVNAISNGNTFLKAGYTAYRHMAHIFHRPGEVVRVLDWGCGCGGVGRHFLADSRFDYFGCDIDPDNLRWCSENLDAARFHALPLKPPRKPLGPPMDAVFGVSVVSHLAPHLIKVWGRWLASNLKPNGLLALTTLGLQAATKESGSLLNEVLAKGCLFSPDDHAIGRIIGNSAYYGTSFQSPAGLAALLSPAFDLIHHGTGEWGHQDLLVFRRR